MNFDLSFMQSIQQPQLLLYLLIVFGALLTFEGLRQLTAGPSAEVQARNRRMQMKSKGIEESKIFETLLRNHSDSGPPKGIVGKLRRSLAQSGLPIGVGGVALLSVCLAVLIFLGASMYVPAASALPIAFGLGFGLPYAIIDRIAQSRNKRLSSQLPDALEMMARGLKVGHPLNVTLRRVARDMPDPIGSEFGLIEDRVRHGVELTMAFTEFAERVENEDARYLAVCVGIQHGTGGNMGRVLMVLSKVIRDRLIMKKKIHAISSEGRLSGNILTVMPFIIFGTIYSSTPGFFEDVMHHPVFLPVSLAVLGLIVMQAIILRRLTNFDF